ncbi:MAG TPA: response regulator, partial [Roseimicrobium sp.]|nr:response regulator [Roseimicrobium sp.]
MVLSQQSGIEVVATCTSGSLAFDTVRALQPDVLVHELSFARTSGIDLVRDVVATSVRTACLAFTRLDAATYAEHYLRAGGRGFVPKTDPIESLVRAIRVVAHGGVFVSETEAGALLGRITGGHNTAERMPLESLST